MKILAPSNPCGIVFAAVVALAAAVAQARHDGTYLNTLEFGLTTPHETWGKPCARGRLKVLFLTGPTGGPRDVAELAQRFDLDADCFIAVGITGQTGDAIGSETMYAAKVEGTSTAEKTRELLQKLARKPHVIVLGGLNPKILPEKCLCAILQAVADGAGLVKTSYRVGAGPVWLEGIPASQPPESLLKTIPYAGLRDVAQRVAASPGKRGPDAADRAKAIATDHVKTAAFGRGRVVSLGYQAGAYGYGCPFRAAVAPALDDDLDAAIQYDYHLRTAAEAILWAAKRDCRYAIAFAQPEGLEIAREKTAGQSLGFSVRRLPGAAGRFTVQARLRDALGRIITEKTIHADSDLTEGAVELPCLARGIHYLELVVASEQGKEAWATSSFRVAAPVGIAGLTLPRAWVSQGAPVELAVAFSGPAPQGATIAVQAIDAFDSVAAARQSSVTAGARETRIELPYPHPVSVGNTLLCMLSDKQGPLDFAWTDLYVHRAEEFERFPSVLWGGGSLSHIDRPLLSQVRRAMFTSILGGSPRHRADFTAVPTILFVQLGAKEGRTTAPNYVVPDAIQKKADASIYNPEVQEHVAKVCRSGVGMHQDRGVFVYNLGDENNFSKEGGAGPCELPEFRKFLQARYPDLATLNACWGTSFSAWDEVKPMSKAEADQAGRAAPYHDRCAFAEEHYARFHEFAAQEIRKIHPGAKVGAEGSESGDLERTLRHLNFWSPYADRVHNCLMRSLAPPDWVGGNWWGGYVASRTPDRNGENLWRQVLSGAANSNWFFMIEAIEGIIAPGYQYADYFQQGCLGDLRLLGDGIGQQINVMRMQESGVFLYYSQVSRHAADIHGQFGNMVSSSEALLSTFQELGISARFLTSRQALAGGLSPTRVKLLILPVTLALSPDEIRCLRTYVSDGGRLVADIAPGILGAHAERAASSAMDDLLGIRREGLSAAKRIPVAASSLRCTSAPVDVSVRAAPGLAHEGPPHAPVFLVNRVGKGQTVLLNFEAASARSTVAPGQEDAWPKLWGKYLNAAGITIACELQGVKGEISRFVMPGLTLLGVLQPERKAGQTGAVRLLDAPHAVYDVIEARYLGTTDRLTFDPGERQSRLYALAKEKFQAPRLRLQDGSLGGFIRCEVQLPLPDGQVHVLRVAATDPKGRDRLELRRYPRAAGRPLTVELPIAHNDLPGTWQITVTDVVSGERASGKVQVSAAGKQVPFPGPWQLDPGLPVAPPEVADRSAKGKRDSPDADRAAAGEPAVAVVHPVTRIGVPPVVDGVMEELWKSVPEEVLRYHLGWEGPMTPVPARLNTTMRLGYDDQALYALVRCNAEHMDKLKTKVTRRDDPSAWTDDSLEIYFDRQNSGIGFLKFVVTAGGALTDMDVRDGQRVDYGWNPGGWRAATRQDATGWSVEMSFPWSDLGGKPGDGDLWSFALLRMSFYSEGCGAVSAPGAGYHNRSHMGYLHFGPVTAEKIRAAAPVISRTKGASWMLFDQAGVSLFRQGALETTPYAVWTDAALDAAQRRLAEARTLVASHQLPASAARWSESVEKAAAMLAEAQKARQAGPSAPVQWADIRSRGNQVFQTADQVVWSVKLHELLQACSVKQGSGKP